MFTSRPRLGQPAHVGGDARVARPVGRRDVHLKADAVDRHALRAQLSHEIVNAIRFLVQPLAAVVVVEEQRLRIGLAGEAEGISDVADRRASV